VPCRSAAVRERETNLRLLRQLRTTSGSEDTRAALTRRNGELTGALVAGPRRPVAPAPASSAPVARA
jgi:hypothetical protein